MRKLTKKIVALAMASTILAVPMTANAAVPANETEVTEEANATGTVQGSGDVEAIVDKDVFAVVLPTVADNASTFDFILDPQEVIKSTSNAAYAGATFNDHTGVYFKKDATTYGKDSAVLTATNKSSYDVDITLAATASNLVAADKSYSIPLTEDSTFADDKTTSLYLALVSGSETKALTAEEGATITNKISALADSYEIAYDAASAEYKYQLKASATGFKTSTFNLTGACNKAADWAAAKDATPEVDVTWTVEKHFETPVSDGSINVVIPYTGNKPANGSISITTPKGTSFTPPAAKYTDGSIVVTNNTITLNAAWLNVVKGNNGVGTYSFTVNGKTRSFKLVDELVTIPTSDGTTNIEIAYTGAKPANGSIAITTPGGSPFTPPAAKYTDGSITVTADKITLNAAWLNVVKTNNGTGTYSFTLNGTTYEFILE